MRRLTGLAFLVIPICGCAALFSGHGSDGALQVNITEQFTIPKEGDVILLPVTFQGKTYQFMLDTGAGMNVFDTALPLGEPITEQSIHGADGDTRLRLYKAPEARVGYLPVPTDEPVMGMDFTMFRQVTGHDVHGMLGMPFLRKYMVRIDFDAAQVVIGTHLDGESGEAFAITHNKIGAPVLKVDVAGVDRHPFILDTGMTSTADLDHDLFEAASKKHVLELSGTTLAQTVTGTASHRSGRLQRLALADLAVTDCVADEAIDSKVGLGFCSRFVLTLDFPHERVCFKKGKRFTTPDSQDTTGLHIVRIDGETVVHSVDKGSLAEAAGLSASDVIVKVKDRPADEATLFELRRLFGEEPESLKFTVRRDRAEKELLLQTKRAASVSQVIGR
jgi:hypothetical protein